MEKYLTQTGSDSTAIATAAAGLLAGLSNIVISCSFSALPGVFIFARRGGEGESQVFPGGDA